LIFSFFLKKAVHFAVIWGKFVKRTVYLPSREMNIQAKITDGIKQLLQTHDYVVIPNFGGFVAQVHFSRFLEENNVLLPPGKIVSFNRQLKQNDGVLIQWLKAELNSSFDNATQQVIDFSNYCSEVLSARRRLNLEGLGFFYLDFENNICFEPKTDEHYHSESFGLSAVVLNELSVIKETIKQTEFIDRKAEVSPATSSKQTKRYLKPLAYIAFGGSILFFALSALIQLNKNNGPLFAGIFNKSENAVYKPIHYPELSLQHATFNIKSYLVNADNISFIELNNKVLAVKMEEEIPNAILKTTKKNSTFKAPKSTGKIGNYQIVLGCFSLEDNAHKMVEKLRRQNISAEITGLNARGMHIVACPGFDNREEAVQFLQGIKDVHPSAWIKARD